MARFQSYGTPIAGWFIVKNPIEIGDYGGTPMDWKPPFKCTNYETSSTGVLLIFKSYIHAHKHSHTHTHW